MRFFITLFSLFLFQFTCAQHIVVYNGLTYSSLKSEDNLVLDESINTYYFGVGINFLEREDRFFYLSTDIGYLTKGGFEKAGLYIDNQYLDLEDKWRYITFNTTFRAKWQFVNSHLYVGAGPKVDLLVSSPQFKSLPYAGILEMKKFNFGGILEAGAVYDIQDFRVGMQGSYLFDFGTIEENSSLDISSKTFLFSLVLGYRL